MCLWLFRILQCFKPQLCQVFHTALAKLCCSRAAIVSRKLILSWFTHYARPSGNMTWVAPEWVLTGWRWACNKDFIPKLFLLLKNAKIIQIIYNYLFMPTKAESAPLIVDCLEFVYINFQINLKSLSKFKHCIAWTYFSLNSNKVSA